VNYSNASSTGQRASTNQLIGWEEAPIGHHQARLRMHTPRSATTRSCMSTRSRRVSWVLLTANIAAVEMFSSSVHTTPRSPTPKAGLPAKTPPLTRRPLHHTDRRKETLATNGVTAAAAPSEVSCSRAPQPTSPIRMICGNTREGGYGAIKVPLDHGDDTAGWWIRSL
jgi:hypothetical protein